MYAFRIYPVTLVVTLLCGQGFAFWPFDVLAAPDIEPTPPYAYSSAKRIAVIGAGAAGSSTVYHLQKFAETSGLQTNVTVFERSSYVGGRSTTVNAFDNPLEPVELGASIFVEVNAILKNASNHFRLNPRARSLDADSELLGIWDGDKFVFTQQEGGWEWWNTAKILWKYGLAPIRTQRLMKTTVGKFLKLYDAPFFPFRSLSDRALDLGLTAVTSMTGEQFLAANNIGAPFSTEIIQASTRVNYASNLGLIHGLETMVCMAIEGAMQIEGGNWKIFDSMLKASNATVHLNSTVTNISKQNGKYVIKTSSPDATTGEVNTIEEPYDTVVLAAPLQYSDIEIEEGLLKHTPDKIPYVQLHVTLFATPLTLSPAYFNLAPDAPVPNTILTTTPPKEDLGNSNDGVRKAGFFSISTLRNVINPKSLEEEYLYKIFSPEKLTSDFLSDIFAVSIPTKLSSINIDSGDAISWYYPYVWNSYPYEYPRVTFEDTELARGFYYTSGIESFISTMETSALMGMNVAQLIVDDHLEIFSSDDKSDGNAQSVLSEMPKNEEL
ncbi:prenylcysteine oxidase [Phlyctema vagabunda]|uniref:Prenylcysteine oxidase n=1 Tax=Phlyctema vagabunda TaxID=108571 RepID=A0ABR4PS88_9HELO